MKKKESFHHDVIEIHTSVKDVKEAAKKRNSVYFISCNDLITNLSNAFKEME